MQYVNTGPDTLIFCPEFNNILKRKELREVVECFSTYKTIVVSEENAKAFVSRCKTGYRCIDTKEDEIL